MPSLPTTLTPLSNRPPTHIKPETSPDASAQPNPTSIQSSRVGHRIAAADAVAATFARIVAKRYPGTNWLPVESSRSNNRLVVPAGKIVRLFPSPADMDTCSGIGQRATTSASERAPHEYGANTGAQ